LLDHTIRQLPTFAGLFRKRYARAREVSIAACGSDMRHMNSSPTSAGLLPKPTKPGFGSNGSVLQERSSKSHYAGSLSPASDNAEPTEPGAEFHGNAKNCCAASAVGFTVACPPVRAR
jgi:hypothetical protein